MMDVFQNASNYVRYLGIIMTMRDSYSYDLSTWMVSFLMLQLLRLLDIGGQQVPAFEEFQDLFAKV